MHKMEVIMEFLVDSYPALLTDRVLRQMVQNNFSLIDKIKKNIFTRLDEIWIEKCTTNLVEVGNTIFHS